MQEAELFSGSFYTAEKIFYMTTGRNGCDKFQVLNPVYISKSS